VAAPRGPTSMPFHAADLAGHVLEHLAGVGPRELDAGGAASRTTASQPGDRLARRRDRGVHALHVPLAVGDRARGSAHAATGSATLALRPGRARGRRQRDDVDRASRASACSGRSARRRARPAWTALALTASSRSCGWGQPERPAIALTPAVLGLTSASRSLSSARRAPRRGADEDLRAPQRLRQLGEREVVFVAAPGRQHHAQRPTTVLERGGDLGRSRQ
jgi:hypothetical protein